MISPTNFEEIKEFIREFLDKTTLDVEAEFLPPEDDTLAVNLKSTEPRILIGERGQTLVDMQHILKAMLRKKINENFYIDLDVNDYKKKKIEYLKEIARTMADDVVLMKKEKILPPMPAYERRVIHMELAGRIDITTESIGREPERKIIIKPYP